MSRNKTRPAEKRPDVRARIKRIVLIPGAKVHAQKGNAPLRIVFVRLGRRGEKNRNPSVSSFRVGIELRCVALNRSVTLGGGDDLDADPPSAAAGPDSSDGGVVYSPNPPLLARIICYLFWKFVNVCRGLCDAVSWNAGSVRCIVDAAFARKWCREFRCGSRS